MFPSKIKDFIKTKINIEKDIQKFLIVHKFRIKKFYLKSLRKENGWNNLTFWILEKRIKVLNIHKMLETISIVIFFWPQLFLGVNAILLWSKKSNKIKEQF